MSNEQDREPGREGVTVERDHPQTRKGESDARGSAEWNENVIDPDEAGGARDQAGGARQPEARTRESDRANELSQEERDAISQHAHGGRSIGDSVGSGAGSDIGSGTGEDTGGLGGGAQGAGEHPGATASPGGSGRSSSG